MADTGKDRVRRHREGLRAAGLRPVQIWIADARRPGFAEQCARESRLVAESDRKDKDLGTFMDDALRDLLDGEAE